MKPGSKKGVGIVILLGLLLSLFIWFLSLHVHSLSLRHATVNLIEEGFAKEIAESAATVFWSFLEDAARVKQGCNALFPMNRSTSPLNLFSGNSPDGISIKPSDFAQAVEFKIALNQVLAFFPDVKSVDLSAGFRVLRQFQDACYGRINLKAEVTLSKSSHSFVFPRDFKLFNILPPVTSKFSLFFRRNTGEEVFNVLQKKYQDDVCREKALIVRNRDTTFNEMDPDTWEKSGWIFIGGRPMIVNLDGSHACRDESENFIFWGHWAIQNPNQELPFACSPYLGNSRLRVRLMPLGCMYEHFQDPQNVRTIGPNEAQKVQYSSILHLFGDKRIMTPTKIFGDVTSRWVLFSTMIYDGNGDKIPEEQNIGGTLQKLLFPIPRLAKNDYQPPFKPQLQNQNGLNLFIPPLGLTGIPNDLGMLLPFFDNTAYATSSYINYMTKISTDFSREFAAYNSLYDQIFDLARIRGNKIFPARNRFDPANDYPNPGTNCRIPSCKPNQNLFSGDLNRFDPATEFLSRPYLFTHQFTADPNETIRAKLIKSGIIKVVNQTNVFIKSAAILASGDLDLLPAALVQAPVLLVVTGDIKLGQVTGNLSGPKLILCSLNGEIEADLSAGNRISASVMAPSKTFKWTGNKIFLKGNLCVKDFSPNEITPFGGTLEYDSSLDPTQENSFVSGYSLFLGPIVRRVLKK